MEPSNSNTVKNWAYILAWTIFWVLVMIGSLSTYTQEPYMEAAQAPTMNLYLCSTKVFVIFPPRESFDQRACSSSNLFESWSEEYIARSKEFDASSAQMVVATVGGEMNIAVRMDHGKFFGKFGHLRGPNLKIAPDTSNPEARPLQAPEAVAHQWASISSSVNNFMVVMCCCCESDLQELSQFNECINQQLRQTLKFLYSQQFTDPKPEVLQRSKNYGACKYVGTRAFCKIIIFERFCPFEQLISFFFGFSCASNV
ncbi:hypothetical protein WICPIJ_001026 [Wickerhamomyces pijperi]|uniref:Uncharacterized protein n=1 Tax=Wickerhamomyces pijperi TaxID=599730 RepID=A0A9P8TR71_WICPI|nr:hypothetical protein WICPIJ_001026 [Wickerhamomyces pijperi]